MQESKNLLSGCCEKLAAYTSKVKYAVMANEIAEIRKRSGNPFSKEAVFLKLKGFLDLMFNATSMSMPR